MFRLLDHPSLWPEWAKRHQINACLLDHPNKKHDPLLRWLNRSPDWQPVYLDELAVLFIRKAPENRGLLDAYAIDLEKDPPSVTPENWKAERNLADFYRKMGNLNQAEVFYRNVLSRFPASAALYHDLGHVLRRQGRSEEALSVYLQATALKPAHPNYHYSLGFLSLELGEEERAFQAFNESGRLAPDFGAAHYQLGRLYVGREDFDGAEKAYLRIRASDEVYFLARNALGILYAEKGEFKKAEREFRDILKVDPNAEGIRKNLKKLERLRNP